MPALTHNRVKNGFNGGRRLNNANLSVINRRISGAVGGDATRSKALVGNIGATNLFIQRAVKRRAVTSESNKCCENTEKKN